MELTVCYHLQIVGYSGTNVVLRPVEVVALPDVQVAELLDVNVSTVWIWEF